MRVAATPFALVFALGVAAAVAPAAAETPELMMAKCRAKAHEALRVRMPDIDTKYEGQRVDGTHAVNGTATTAAGDRTFQCSFNRAGSKIVRFVVNEAAPPPASSGMPSRNEQACLQAVSRTTGNGDVVLLRSETSEANDLVVVGVGPKRAPWRCLVSKGVVAEVTSMVDEGRL